MVGRVNVPREEKFTLPLYYISNNFILYKFVFFILIIQFMNNNNFDMERETRFELATLTLAT